MKTVTVVGAGFSGLTLAHELRKQGFAVEVHEKQERAGGLLDTEKSVHGLIETAANALLADVDIEALFAELGVTLAQRRPSARKRYIYWNGMRRWPLSMSASFRLLLSGARLAFGAKDLQPHVGESVASWARRFAGEEFAERLLAPALQGVYAGDPEEMSAVLILTSLFGGRAERRRGAHKGSVAPVAGMGQLIRALTLHLEADGVQIHYESNYSLPDYLTTPVVVATSAWQAAKILRAKRPRMAALLDTVQTLPLVSITAFFEPTSRDAQGFGCLFPRGQGFAALGVLFNDCIFAGRSRFRSETWIFGGASRPDMAAQSDDDLLRALLQDRDRMGSDFIKPLDYKITRWPHALPHYTVAWERSLSELHDEPPVYLHGNYLGQLGLSRIYARSRELARRLKDNHG